MKLSDLKIGQEAKVTKLNIDKKDVKRHLLDMGLTKGTTVRIKKSTPMGDPITIELRGYELCVGKADLEKIDVEVKEMEKGR